MNPAARRLLAALALAPALSGCAASLADRYAAGNRALATPEGAQYFVRIGPILHRSINACIAANEASPSPTLVFVADIAADGAPSNVAVEPDSAGSDCIERQLRETTFPRPPLAPGAATFPVGLRIDDAK